MVDPGSLRRGSKGVRKNWGINKQSVHVGESRKFWQQRKVQIEMQRQVKAKMKYKTYIKERHIWHQSCKVVSALCTFWCPSTPRCKQALPPCTSPAPLLCPSFPWSHIKSLYFSFPLPSYKPTSNRSTSISKQCVSSEDFNYNSFLNLSF